MYLNSLCGFTDGLQRREDEIDMLCLVTELMLSLCCHQVEWEVGLIAFWFQNVIAASKDPLFWSGLRLVFTEAWNPRWPLTCMFRTTQELCICCLQCYSHWRSRVRFPVFAGVAGSAVFGLEFWFGKMTAISIQSALSSENALKTSN